MGLRCGMGSCWRTEYLSARMQFSLTIRTRVLPSARVGKNSCPRECAKVLRSGPMQPLFVAIRLDVTHSSRRGRLSLATWKTTPWLWACRLVRLDTCANAGRYCGLAWLAGAAESSSAKMASCSRLQRMGIRWAEARELRPQGVRTKCAES